VSFKQLGIFPSMFATTCTFRTGSALEIILLQTHHRTRQPKIPAGVKENKIKKIV
jgi:hypothetical protein